MDMNVEKVDRLTFMIEQAIDGLISEMVNLSTHVESFLVELENDAAAQSCDDSIDESKLFPS